MPGSVWKWLYVGIQPYQILEANQNHLKLLFMKTKSYNPSQLEVDFATAVSALKGDIEKHLAGNKILNIENRQNQDNPMVFIKTEDEDGDQHELVIKIIQRPDEY